MRAGSRCSISATRTPSETSRSFRDVPPDDNRERVKSVRNFLRPSLYVPESGPLPPMKISPRKWRFPATRSRRPNPRACDMGVTSFPLTPSTNGFFDLLSSLLPVSSAAANFKLTRGLPQGVSVAPPPLDRASPHITLRVSPRCHAILLIGSYVEISNAPDVISRLSRSKPMQAFAVRCVNSQRAGAKPTFHSRPARYLAPTCTEPPTMQLIPPKQAIHRPRISSWLCGSSLLALSRFRLHTPPSRPKAEEG